MYEKFMRHGVKLKPRYELHHSTKSPARRVHAKRKRKIFKTFYIKARSRLALLMRNKSKFRCSRIQKLSSL